MRAKFTAFFCSNLYNTLISSLILFNALILGLDTIDSVKIKAGELLFMLDRACIIIFTLELVLKLYTFGLGFFTGKDKGWNIFDFIIILVSVFESMGLSVFRVFRVFRVLRLLSSLPRLRFVTEAMLHTMPSLFSVGLILFVFYYVYALLCVNLFKEVFPQWFGHLGRSFYTLFQIMTLEGWSDGIVRPILEVYPYAWVIFISFILIVSFVVLNLVIGVVVESINEMKEQERILKSKKGEKNGK